MRGVLYNTKHNGWMVKFNKKELNPNELGVDELQLHPDDVNEIIEQSIWFDNIEARIAAYPEVKFQIVENEKMSGVVRYAKLIKDDFSEWDVTLNDGLDETT